MTEYEFVTPGETQMAKPEGRRASRGGGDPNGTLASRHSVVANAALAHARAWGIEDRIERAIRQSCALSGELLDDLTDGLPRA